MELEVFEGRLGQVVEVDASPARSAGSGLTEPTSLAWMPKPRGDHEQAVLVAGLRFADVDGASRRPGRGVGVPIAKVPILELSGQFAGPSEPKFACASVQVALPVGGIGVDREARREGDDRALSSEGEAAKP